MLTNERFRQIIMNYSRWQPQSHTLIHTYGSNTYIQRSNVTRTSAIVPIHHSDSDGQDVTRSTVKCFPSGHTTQKERQYYVKTTSRRRFDVIMTLLSRHVPRWVRISEINPIIKFCNNDKFPFVTWCDNNVIVTQQQHHAHKWPGDGTYQDIKRHGIDRPWLGRCGYRSARVKCANHAVSPYQFKQNNQKWSNTENVFHISIRYIYIYML